MVEEGADPGFGSSSCITANVKFLFDPCQIKFDDFLRTCQGYRFTLMEEQPSIAKRRHGARVMRDEQ
jgi:hypothetical protein